MTTRESDPRAPVPLALVVSDGRYVDTVTARWSILGLLNSLIVSELPYVQQTLVAYIAVSEVVRDFEVLTVRLVDLKEELPPLFEVEEVLEAADPTEMVERMFVVNEVEFTEPGEYMVQLLASGSLLAERRLRVILDQREEPA